MCINLLLYIYYYVNLFILQKSEEIFDIVPQLLKNANSSFGNLDEKKQLRFWV